MTTDSLNLDCCDETHAANPKSWNKSSRRSTTSSFGYVASPIEFEVIDTEELKKGYKKYPYVPVFDGQGRMLDFFQKLREVTPTHAAVIASQKRYVVGEGFTVLRKKESGFVNPTSDEVLEVSELDFQTFTDWIIENIMLGEQLISLAEKVFENFVGFGNAWLEIAYSEVAGQREVKIFNHDAQRVRYFPTGPLEDKLVLISKSFNEYYMDKYPPDLVGVWPNVTQDDGVFRTMIHCMNYSPGRDWYGIPPWLGALYYAYNEFQLGDYTTKEYASDFTGRVFFETEGDDEDQDGIESFRQAMKRVFTRGGEGDTILHRNRGHEVAPTDVHEFSPNTNEKFHSAMATLSEDQIIKAHGWHRLLMGLKIPGSLGNGTEFEHVFMERFISVIKPYQQKVLWPINQALAIAAGFLEDTQMVDVFTLGFDNILKRSIEEKIEAQESSETQEIVAEIEEGGQNED